MNLENNKINNEILPKIKTDILKSFLETLTSKPLFSLNNGFIYTKVKHTTPISLLIAVPTIENKNDNG